VSAGRGTPQLLICWKTLGTVEQKSWARRQKTEGEGGGQKENSHILLKFIAVQKFEILQSYFAFPVLSYYPSGLQKEVFDFPPFWSQRLIISNLLSVGGQGLAQILVLQTLFFLLRD